MGELLWLRTLLDDLGMTTNGSMQLFCDNKATISIANESTEHDMTKHIEIDRHFSLKKS